MLVQDIVAPDPHIRRDAKLRGPPPLIQPFPLTGNQVLIQSVLAESTWMARMELEDFRALTPLIYAHVNPYGSFELDMEKRLVINFEAEIAA